MITYCTNIHPAESWEETFSALREHIPAVKSAVSPGRPFPIGLRLSNTAACRLTAPENERFTEWLEEQECFIPTLNGFPYGAFHNERIKERVYLPDWRSSERAAYTIRLAELLAAWLPENVTGSISTVPLGFKGDFGREDIPLAVQRLRDVLSHLAMIHDERGKQMLLALEPEPGCLLETTDDVCRFFSDLPLPDRLQRHLAICYDCCHQAVEFEDPLTSITRLRGAGIRIAKVQASSAIRVVDPASSLLQHFAEPAYLHQVVIRRGDGSIVRYADLPLALEGHARQAEDEWRCHFHVPIFLEEHNGLGTTRAFLQGLLPHLRPDTLLEVETYTWDVLPPALRSGPVTDSIIREISWLKEQLDATHRCP